MPPVRSRADLEDAEPAHWERVATTTALSHSYRLLLGFVGPWLALDLARTLRRDPSLLQNAVTYHLLLAATKCQFASLYGPPGAGKTRLMIYLTAMYLTATSRTNVCLASSGNTTIASTATDFATLLPSTCFLAHHIVRVVSKNAKDAAPSPFDTTNANDTLGRRFSILTTGMLGTSPYTFYLYRGRFHWVIGDEAQQLYLARDLLIALLGVEGAMFTYTGDPKQPHLVAEDTLKQLHAELLEDLCRPGLMSEHLVFLPKDEWRRAVHGSLAILSTGLPPAEACLQGALAWVETDLPQPATFAQAWGLAPRLFPDPQLIHCYRLTPTLCVLVGCLHSPEAMSATPYYFRLTPGGPRPYEITDSGTEGQAFRLPLVVPNFPYRHPTWAPAGIYWLELPRRSYPQPDGALDLSPYKGRRPSLNVLPKWIAALEGLLALLLLRFGNRAFPPAGERNACILALSPFSIIRDAIGLLYPVGTPADQLLLGNASSAERIQDSWHQCLEELHLPSATWEDHLQAMRQYPHLVRDRAQVDTTINDTGNTQAHTIVHLPYISKLARNEAASLVGISRQRGTLWIMGPVRDGIEAMGTTWGWTARACRDLGVVLTQEEGAGGLTLSNTVRLGLTGERLQPRIRSGRSWPRCSSLALSKPPWLRRLTWPMCSVSPSGACPTSATSRCPRAVLLPPLSWWRSPPPPSRLRGSTI